MPLYLRPGGGGSVATDTIFDAKGDLAVGTGANSSARLAIGANGTVLTADSGEATGAKWAAVAGTGDVTAAANITDNAIVAGDGGAKGVQGRAITISDVAGANVSMTATTGNSLTLATLDNNKNLIFTPHGTGLVAFSKGAVPATTDGAALGSATLMWSDLFMASGSVINLDNGNWVATHSSGILTVGTGDLRVTTAGTNAASAVTVGGAQTLTNKVLTAATITTSLVPTSSDGAALGSGTNMFSDLFLASGGVVNFNNGDVTVTHSAGTLTCSGTLATTTLAATTANVTTFKILDSVDQSHGLSFVVGTNLTADRTLTITTGDANRTVTIQGDVTLPAGTALVSGGALGTPSSGTLTNCTGLPASGIAAGVLGGNITLGESTGQIILDAALSADGTWSGICEAGTAGATLAFGDLVYLAAADSRWELADADAASTSGDVILGFCVLAAAADGDPTTILYRGKIRADAAFPDLTIGAPAYVGTTAGDIQVAQPSGTDDVIRRVGWGKTINELIVDIEPNYITHT